MFGTILGFLGSGVFGSIVGVVGNWLNQRMIRKNKELEFQHEQEMARINIDMIEAQAAAAIKINTAKIEGEIDLTETEAYNTNIALVNRESFSDQWMDTLLETTGWRAIFAWPLAGMLLFFFGMIDIMKGFMRPSLTIFFTVAAAWITYISFGIINQKGLDTLSVEQAILYFTLAVDTCFMLTTTCVTWWFADRRMAKNLERIYNKRLDIPNKE